MGCCVSSTSIDRETGERVKEQIPFSAAIELDSLYGCVAGRCLIRTWCFRSYLRLLSRTLGEMYDSPSSKQKIAKFIRDYGVNVSEIEKPVEQYKTLNEFFTRRFQPNARPIYESQNANIAVQPCDCRLKVFDSVSDARKFWVKGSDFTASSLLGSKELASEFFNCSLMICRLTPTDYHRFHSPVECVVGPHIRLGEDCLSVKPIAVTSSMDTLTSNERVVLILNSKQFGKVAYIMIGATTVSSVNITVSENQHLNKGDEIGYFAYGGSTVVVIFQQDRILFDDDLRNMSWQRHELLVKVGTSLGRAAHSTAVNDRKKA